MQRFFFISRVTFQDESMIHFWKHLEGELVLSFVLSIICDETLQLVHISNQASVNNAKYRQNTNWLWASNSFEDSWIHRSQEWSTRLFTFKSFFLYFCFNSYSYLGFFFLAIPLLFHCACCFSVRAHLPLVLNTAFKYQHCSLFSTPECRIIFKVVKNQPFTTELTHPKFDNF